MQFIRSLKFWLIASLAVNFVLIGLFIGGAQRAHSHKSALAGPRDALGLLLRALPHEEAREIGNDVRGRMRRGGPHMENVEMLASWIEATPFDAAPITGFFAAGQREMEQIVNDTHARIIDVIGEMDDAERAELAKRLRERMDDHGKRKGKRRKGPRGERHPPGAGG